MLSYKIVSERIYRWNDQCFPGCVAKPPLPTRIRSGNMNNMTVYSYSNVYFRCTASLDCYIIYTNIKEIWDVYTSSEGFVLSFVHFSILWLETGIRMINFVTSSITNRSRWRNGRAFVSYPVGHEFKSHLCHVRVKPKCSFAKRSAITGVLVTTLQTEVPCRGRRRHVKKFSLLRHWALYA